MTEKKTQSVLQGLRKLECAEKNYIGNAPSFAALGDLSYITGYEEGPPSQLLGEHNEYVFKELLGLFDEEINRFVKEKVIF